MKQLGIEPVLLLAQIVNFGILFYVLKRAIYPKLLAMLDKRQKQIADGITLTQKLKDEEEKIKAKQEKLVSEAKKDARAIVEDAKKQAEEEHKAIIAQAHQEAAEVLVKAKAQADLQLKAREESMRHEAVELATVMVRRLVPQVLSDEDHHKLIVSHLKDLEKVAQKAY